jgi:hypothetical protein
MICVDRVSDNVSFHDFIEVEKQQNQLIIALEQKIKQAKDYVKTNELKEELNRVRRFLGEIKLLRKFAIGDFVQNGSATPGEVVALKVEEQRALVDIIWWDTFRVDSKPPINLIKLDPEDLAYVWDGQRNEKLIRKCDRFECADIDILRSELETAKKEYATTFKENSESKDIYTKRVIYCEKRIATLVSKETKKVTPSQQQMLLRLFGEEKQEKRLQKLSLNAIFKDTRCQQRECLDESVIEEYRAAFESGIQLPPIKVMFDGASHYLYDGFHTTKAAELAGLMELRAEITQGDLRDAILASVGVNSAHGLRRSNETKRNAVMTLLQDEQWSQWSNCEIARRCKVSEGFVRKLKNAEDGKEIVTSYIRSDNTENDNCSITSYIRSDNTENDNKIIAGISSSDNRKKYKDRYGNTSIMDVENIGKANSTNGHLEVTKNTNSTKELLPDQLLQIHLFDLKAVSEDLKRLNHHYCTIERKSEVGNSYHVRDLESGSVKVVMAEDLRVVESASISLSFSPSEYQELLILYGGNRNGLEAEIKKILLGGKVG